MLTYNSHNSHSDPQAQPQQRLVTSELRRFMRLDDNGMGLDDIPEKPVIPTKHQRVPCFNPDSWFANVNWVDPDAKYYLRRKIDDPDCSRPVWAYVRGLTKDSQMVVEAEGLDGRNFSRCWILPEYSCRTEKRGYEEFMGTTRSKQVSYGAMEDLALMNVRHMFINNIAMSPQKSTKRASKNLVELITKACHEDKPSWKWYPRSGVERALGESAKTHMNRIAPRPDKPLSMDDLTVFMGGLNFTDRAARQCA
ncbi:hypothetical protein NUW58_g1071 [Xylaria curta]|uniref:Uncharacterized protein n=1 Tax=Xylaria curta TaxID=42375 RepID=A0ACC1PN85_9PEZI|nr:hypothetical protein NUW58_g1071 [Xylaria curta]